ncbi:class I SAM-dependent methyltransferase [Sulfurovum mangrovi]|uniref:class I SAM-dependent methyltransferase n=1 Tax=Sulfurovum mangrovi TaxID=2893889 RepID=UPI001E570B58|nr:class I SAM-dependent methyltransferase [Sulfurovum mangrovi]UFH58334.1 class I SAM-dependent methyltransferase [Sulfurovum mangrovi]
MKAIQEKLASTIHHYENNADGFIASYESADMSTLHRTIVDHLDKSSKLLDIGFGSGRDLAFLRENGFDIWGADPSEKFVAHAQRRFPDISNHFFTTALPNLELPSDLKRSFDEILLIAVWMHLPQSTYEDAIRSLCSFLKPGGTLILSYSITQRDEKSERYFEDIDRELLQNLFKKHNCHLTASHTNSDGLNERDITWVTEVYTYNKEVS